MACHVLQRVVARAGSRNPQQLTYELAQVRRIVDEIIAERRSQRLQQPVANMLGLLLAARDAENA